MSNDLLGRGARVSAVSPSGMGLMHSKEGSRSICIVFVVEFHPHSDRAARRMWRC